MTSLRGCLARTHWRGREVLGCGTPWGLVVGAWAEGVLVGAAVACRPCGPQSAVAAPTDTQLFSLRAAAVLHEA